MSCKENFIVSVRIYLVFVSCSNVTPIMIKGWYITVGDRMQLKIVPWSSVGCVDYVGSREGGFKLVTSCPRLCSLW